MASFACLEYYQLRLSPKVQIPTECTQCGHDIEYFIIQKLLYIFFSPSCAYPQYKYGYIFA